MVLALTRWILFVDNSRTNNSDSTEAEDSEERGADGGRQSGRPLSAGHRQIIYEEGGAGDVIGADGRLRIMVMVVA